LRVPVRCLHGSSPSVTESCGGWYCLLVIRATASNQHLWNHFIIFWFVCLQNQTELLWLGGMWNRTYGGYHTEYSSMKMGFYLFAEYANMFISSTILAIYSLEVIIILEWVGLLKLGVILVIFWIWCFISNCVGSYFSMCGWTIPRFRYDQLMHLGWRILIPLAIINIIITGIVILRAEIAYLGF
jgi:hypothetical protein